MILYYYLLPYNFTHNINLKYMQCFQQKCVQWFLGEDWFLVAKWI